MGERHDTKRILGHVPGQPGMQASVVASTVMFAVSRGIPMERITAVTGVERRDLLDPDARLSQDIVPAVWRLLGQACPGQAIALDMASAAPYSFFGTLGHAARFASNLRAGLNLIVRYRALLSDTLHLELVETPPEAAFRVHHPMDSVDGGYGAEAGLGLGWRIMRDVYGVEALERVELAHPPIGSAGEYQRFFAAEVRFEQPHNALVLGSEALERPVAGPSDPQMFRFIQEHLDLARERLAVESGSGEMARIRQAIAHNAERSEYGAEALARQLGMSLRALQRMTRAHDTTVRKLLDEARQANARQLLSDPRLSVEQISFLVGYSEDRAFRRAFKRWTGQTPAELRRSLGRDL